MQSICVRRQTGAGRAVLLPPPCSRWPGGSVVAGCKSFPEILSLRLQYQSHTRLVVRFVYHRSA
jgi:hypothetical protein